MGTLRVELFVADVRRSVRFYREVLGFDGPTDPEGEYVAVRRGGAVIGLGRMDRLPGDHPVVASAGERVGLGVELVVEVVDVDVAADEVVAAGHPLASPVREQPWGLRDFRVIDPDGYYIRVTTAS